MAYLLPSLVNRLNNLQFQLDNWDDATSATTELTVTQALIAGLTPVVNALPDGDDKRRSQNQLNRCQTRANNLTGSRELRRASPARKRAGPRHANQ